MISTYVIYYSMKYSTCELQHSDGSPASIFGSSHRMEEKAVGLLFKELAMKKDFRMWYLLLFDDILLESGDALQRWLGRAAREDCFYTHTL